MATVDEPAFADVGGTFMGGPCNAVGIFPDSCEGVASVEVTVVIGGTDYRHVTFGYGSCLVVSAIELIMGCYSWSVIDVLGA